MSNRMMKVQKVVQTYARVEFQDEIFRVYPNGTVDWWDQMGFNRGWVALSPDGPDYEEIRKAGLEALAQ